jgi:hypothetical protein
LPVRPYRLKGPRFTFGEVTHYEAAMTLDFLRVFPFTDY